MKPLTLHGIARMCAVALPCEADRQVTGLCLDTRKLAPGQLFVAIKGQRDGHHFVPQAARQGAAGAIVEQDYLNPEVPGDFPLLRVRSPLETFQFIARQHRLALPLRVLAITGSNGKTSTKDFAAAILAERFRVLKTEGNFNNHLGVPLTLLRGAPDHEVAVLEMGMNHFGEIAPLCTIARPEVGIITNIGTAHIEYLGTREGIAREKGELAAALRSKGLLVLNAHDDFTSYLKARSRARVIEAGIGRGTIRAENVRFEMGAMQFDLHAPEGRVEIRVPVVSEHMVVNALLAVGAALHFGLTLEECAHGLAQSRLTGGRLQFRHLEGLAYLDDTYNANPESVIAALQTLKRLPVSGRRIAVLGGMGELGETAEAGHRRVGAASAQIDQLLAIGPTAWWIIDAARQAGCTSALAFESIPEASAWLRRHGRPEDLILVKGSRSARMEKIFDPPAWP